MGRYAYVNGRYVDHREASVHIEDRGYQLADGVYEVVGVRDGRLIDEGATRLGGRIPVNVSGGLKAKGHPVGATGVSMHVMTAMQLSGTAPGGLQLPKARLGGVFNMGGAAVANYVSILEPLR